MTRQQFHTIDVLAVEVEDDQPGGLTNLIRNPSGEQGAWGWTTPDSLWNEGHLTRVTGSFTGSATALRYQYTGPVAVSAPVLSEPFPVTPGRYVAAAWKATIGGAGHVIQFNWLDADGAYLGNSSSTVSGSTEQQKHPAALVPTGAVTAQLSFDLALDTKPLTFWDATVVQATTAAAANAVTHLDPPPQVGILGSSVTITVARESLNTSTLTASIRDVDLDPSQSALLRPGRRARIRLAATDDLLMTGTVTDAVVTYELKESGIPDHKRARVELTINDPLTPLANQRRPDGVATLEELRAVLEGAGIPWNINGSGDQIETATAVATNENASAVDQVAITRDSVHGIAWIDRQGVLNAWDPATYDAAHPIAAVLDEDDYTNLDLSWSTEDLINEVSVTFLRYNPTTKETQEIAYGPYRDQESIETWGAHAADFTIQGLVEDAPTIAAFAQEVLDTNATPQLRVNSLTLAITEPAHLTTRALLDLGQRVRITNTAKALDQTLRIAGLTHTITPDKWLLTLTFTGTESVPTPTFTPPVSTVPPPAAPDPIRAYKRDVTVTSGAGSLAMTFTPAFTTAPVVVATAGTQGGGWIVTVANVTASGCTLNVVHRVSTTNTTIPVSVIAMES